MKGHPFQYEQIKRNSSSEHHVLQQVEQLEKEEWKIEAEKAKLSETWIDLEKKHQAYQDEHNKFEEKVANKLDFLPVSEIISYNVGGQIFEAPVQLWIKDRYSILAQLCTKKPLMKKDSNDCFFFDRDWWIFRYIFLFLRDKTLPDSIHVLRELYYEASFYKIVLLRQAIEARLMKSHDDLTHMRQEEQFGM